MRTIRASEIGSYIYCQRAWWYQKTGVVPENQSEISYGSRMHLEHGKRIFRAGCVQGLAYLLLLIAIVMATAYFASQLY